MSVARLTADELALEKVRCLVQKRISFSPMQKER